MNEPVFDQIEPVRNSQHEMAHLKLTPLRCMGLIKGEEMSVKFEVCYPSTATVVKSFRTLKAAKQFAKNMTEKDLPFLVMPWDEGCCPIIKRTEV